MSKNLNKILLSSLFVVGLYLSGCQDENMSAIFTEEIAKAEKVVSQLKRDEAPKYVPVQFKETQNTFYEGKSFVVQNKFGDAKTTLDLFYTLADKTRRALISAKNSRISNTVNENKPTQVKEEKVYVVKRRDNLWNIAKSQSVYGDPFRWKEIYEANKEKINVPRLIYPNQTFTIPN